MPAIKPPWGINKATIDRNNWRLGGTEMVGFWPFNLPVNTENTTQVNGPKEVITDTFGQRTVSNASVGVDALQVWGRNVFISAAAGGTFFYTPVITTWFTRALPICVMARVRLNTVAAIMPIWSNNAGAGGQYRGAFMLVDASGKLNCGFGDNTSSVADTGRRYKIGTTALLANTYYDLACVVRGATDMSLYVNGVDDGGSYAGTGGAMAYANTLTTTIGVTNGFGLTAIKGNIDYVMQLAPPTGDTDIAGLVVANVQADPWALVPSTNAIPWMSKKRIVRLSASKPLESWTGNFGATAFANAPPLRYYGWPA